MNSPSETPGGRPSSRWTTPAGGLTARQRGYPFQGALWNHDDRRIEILLGQPSTTCQLTRGIVEVRAVDVVQDSTGRDLAMRIAHGQGHSILTLIR